MDTEDGSVQAKFTQLCQRLDGQLRPAILHSLPNLAIQIDELWAKYSQTTLNQDENLPKVDEQLTALHAMAFPLSQEAIEQVHLIESRIRRLTADVRLSAEVLVGEVLDRSLKLAEGLRRDLEDLLVQLNNFHSHRSFHIRKMLKHPGQGPEALIEFDRKSISMIRVQLAKVRNVMVTLYKILAANMDNLTREQPMHAGESSHSSSIYQ